MFALDLSCSMTVYTPITLRLPYPGDEHWILCPDCQYNKHRLDSLVLSEHHIPTAWQRVLEVREVPDSDDDPDMLILRSKPSLIVYGDRILRLQPSVPSNRIHPFPYKTRRFGVRIS